MGEVEVRRKGSPRTVPSSVTLSSTFSWVRPFQLYSLVMADRFLVVYTDGARGSRYTLGVRRHPVICTNISHSWPVTEKSPSSVLIPSLQLKRHVLKVYRRPVFYKSTVWRFLPGFRVRTGNIGSNLLNYEYFVSLTTDRIPSLGRWLSFQRRDSKVLLSILIVLR